MRSWTCPTIVLLIAVAVLPGRTRAAPAISLGDLDGPADVCYPETCSVPQEDTFFSYAACCDNECCTRLRFWVYPASIAAIGFIAGAFFALCFQCR